MIEKKKKLFWFFTLFFITFNGCTAFPLYNFLGNFSGCLLTMEYIFIGIFFAGLVRKNFLKVFLLTMLFIAVGMGLRYILEFGEVSAGVNFVTCNVVTSIFGLPSFVTFVYWLCFKFK